MLIKKFLFSFCWICVLSTTAHAALPSVIHTPTAPRTVTAAPLEELPCNR